MSFGHVLLMRTDHLGDMLLTLPMATALKTALPHCRVSVLASRANAAAAEHHPDVDHVEIDTQESKGSNLSGVFLLAQRLRALACDAAIIVHPTPRLAVAAFLARIPVRVGTAFRAYSLLFNRRLRQHRRDGQRHEAELNLELLTLLGIAATEAPRGAWKCREEEILGAARGLKELGVLDRSFVVLHPGNAGSTLNWQPQQYAELGRSLVASGMAVVVTGGPGEIELAAQVVDGIGAGAASLAGKLSLGELAEVLRRAAAYVGSPTGPTHLAAIVGTEVIALFPPLRSTLPSRWRPLGKHVTLLQPEVGQVCVRCLLEACPHFPCMERRLESGRVATEVLQRVEARRDGQRQP